MTFSLRPVQRPMVDFLLDHKRGTLASFMGSGKTSAVLTVCDALLLSGSAKRILIMGPLRVARSTWSDEARRYFPHLSVAVVVGKPEERYAALARNADISTVNYQVIQWLVDHYGEKDWPFDTVIADESVMLKGVRTRQGSKWGQALKRVAFTKVLRWYNLTGMMTENGLGDLWGQQFWVDQGQRLGRSYSAFEARWFRAVPNRGKGAFATMEPMPHAQGETQDLILDVCLMIDPKDWYQLAEPIVTTVKVELPPEARKRYREMEKDFYTKVQGHAIEAFAAGAKSQKLKQLASGSVYLDPSVENDEDPGRRAWKEVHDEKLQALESIVNEMGGAPLLVAYHFVSDLARLTKRFPQGRSIKTLKDEDAFKAGTVPIGFVHPKSIGHGVDGLQRVCNTLVFFSSDWAAGPHFQLVERIGPMRQMQAGLDRPVFLYYLVARATVDEDVMERLRSKHDVFETLMAGIKRRTEE